MTSATVLRTATQRPTTRRHRAGLFADAVSIMEAEYPSQLSIDDVSRRIACSRRQLQRAFDEIGETTFRQYLTAVRMKRAAELLTTRCLPVREVAQLVAYRQPAQFAKTFRCHHGVSPSVFRRRRRLRVQAAVVTDLT